MIIEKKQTDKKRYTFNWVYFNSAREGLKYILQDGQLKNKRILLPAYIGYSTRESSGVFDPVRQTDREYLFYRLDKRLYIDTKDIAKKMKENKSHILFIIHYFGFLDPNLTTIRGWAAKYNMITIEDFAQAFFTFWLNPQTSFNYAIFSIHKLFPVDSGGIVLARDGLGINSEKKHGEYSLFNYNIKDIAEKRVENYKYLLLKINKIKARYKIEVLRKDLKDAIPQTFPLLLNETGLRDFLYFKMNEKGYGVVSLYHALIDEIDRSFTIEHGVSGRILNLPVHQDVEKKDLGRMVDAMSQIIDTYKGGIN